MSTTINKLKTSPMLAKYFIQPTPLTKQRNLSRHNPATTLLRSSSVSSFPKISKSYNNDFSLTKLDPKDQNTHSRKKEQYKSYKANNLNM